MLANCIFSVISIYTPHKAKCQQWLTPCSDSEITSACEHTSCSGIGFLHTDSGGEWCWPDLLGVWSHRTIIAANQCKLLPRSPCYQCMSTLTWRKHLCGWMGHAFPTCALFWLQRMELSAIHVWDVNCSKWTEITYSFHIHNWRATIRWLGVLVTICQEGLELTRCIRAVCCLQALNQSCPIRIKMQLH